jgi:hypothetical protein
LVAKIKEAPRFITSPTVGLAGELSTVIDRRYRCDGSGKRERLPYNETACRVIIRLCESYDVTRRRAFLLAIAPRDFDRQTEFCLGKKQARFTPPLS